jgi:hypothetical protein
MRKITEFKYLLAIFIIALILFFPSLNNFYTHDDFFLLKISKVESFKEFVNFYNLKSSPEGLGMYRPLAMQSFFMVAWKLFNLNPLGLHIISFIFFFGIVFLVYKLTVILMGNKKVGLFAAFFYATSSTHFAHLYWLSVFQELAMTLFFLLSVIFFIKFVRKGRKINFLISFFAFLLSLLSKETAIVLPLILTITYFYLCFTKNTILSIKKIFIFLTPFFLILSAYLYMRINYYGFPKGASYIWDFSPRFLNTLFWYGLWSINIPEMLIDFIGPGLKINIGPLVYWKNYLITIIISSLALVMVIFLKLLAMFNKRKTNLLLIIFGSFWFIFTILPVLFLPWHKFAYYLTLPLIGMVLVIAYIITGTKMKRWQSAVFLTAWLISSMVNINLLSKTSWIIKGGMTSSNVFTYFNENIDVLSGKNVVFYDMPQDEIYAPWYPSDTLKTVLSDTDFFEVFFPEIRSTLYLRDGKLDNGSQTVSLEARQFVEYQF